MANIRGKNVVIVGGTHGIGLATAKRVVDGGANLIVAGRSSGPIEEAKKHLGDSTIVTEADITSMADIEALGALVKNIRRRPA